MKTRLYEFEISKRWTLELGYGPMDLEDTDAKVVLGLTWIDETTRVYRGWGLGILVWHGHFYVGLTRDNG